MNLPEPIRQSSEINKLNEPHSEGTYWLETSQGLKPIFSGQKMTVVKRYANEADKAMGRTVRYLPALTEVTVDFIWKSDRGLWIRIKEEIYKIRWDIDPMRLKLTNYGEVKEKS